MFNLINLKSIILPTCYKKTRVSFKSVNFINSIPLTHLNNNSNLITIFKYCILPPPPKFSTILHKKIKSDLAC